MNNLSWNNAILKYKNRLELPDHSLQSTSCLSNFQFLYLGPGLQNSDVTKMCLACLFQNCRVTHHIARLCKAPGSSFTMTKVNFTCIRMQLYWIHTEELFASICVVLRQGLSLQTRLANKSLLSCLSSLHAGIPCVCHDTQLQVFFRQPSFFLLCNKRGRDKHDSKYSSLPINF